MRAGRRWSRGPRRHQVPRPRHTRRLRSQPDRDDFLRAGGKVRGRGVRAGSARSITTSCEWLPHAKSQAQPGNDQEQRLNEWEYARSAATDPRPNDLLMCESRRSQLLTALRRERRSRGRTRGGRLADSRERGAPPRVHDAVLAPRADESGGCWRGPPEGPFGDLCGAPPSPRSCRGVPSTRRVPRFGSAKTGESTSPPPRWRTLVSTCPDAIWSWLGRAESETDVSSFSYEWRCPLTPSPSGDHSQLATDPQ